MSAPISNINQITALGTLAFLATVVATNNKDKITAVKALDSDKTLKVVAQAIQLFQALPGDTVLVQNTPQGLMAIVQIGLESDAPAARIINNQGNIEIKGEQSVCITTNKGSIKVCGDGKVLVIGQEIYANSEQEISLTGWPIRLN